MARRQHRGPQFTMATAWSSSRTSSPRARRFGRPCCCPRPAPTSPPGSIIHPRQLLVRWDRPRAKTTIMEVQEQYGSQVHAMVDVFDIYEYPARPGTSQEPD